MHVQNVAHCIDYLHSLDPLLPAETGQLQPRASQPLTEHCTDRFKDNSGVSCHIAHCPHGSSKAGGRIPGLFSRVAVCFLPTSDCRLGVIKTVLTFWLLQWYSCSDPLR